MQFGAGQAFLLSLLSGGEEVSVSAAIEVGVTVSSSMDVSVNVSTSVVTCVAVTKLRCTVNFERCAVRYFRGGLASVRSGCNRDCHSWWGDQHVRRRTAERNCDTGAGDEAPKKVVVCAVVPGIDTFTQLNSRRSQDGCGAER
jgi:hypothetical protein